MDSSNTTQPLFLFPSIHRSILLRPQPRYGWREGEPWKVNLPLEPWKLQWTWRKTEGRVAGRTVNPETLHPLLHSFSSSFAVLPSVNRRRKIGSRFGEPSTKWKKGKTAELSIVPSFLLFHVIHEGLWEEFFFLFLSLLFLCSTFSILSCIVSSLSSQLLSGGKEKKKEKIRRKTSHPQSHPLRPHIPASQWGLTPRLPLLLLLLLRVEVPQRVIG